MCSLVSFIHPSLYQRVEKCMSVSLYIQKGQAYDLICRYLYIYTYMVAPTKDLCILSVLNFSTYEHLLITILPVTIVSS